MKKISLFTPGVLALESGLNSPDFRYTPNTSVATEGFVDEVKATYSKIVEKLTGSLDKREKDSEENDKAASAMEKSLRYLKSQISMAKFDRTKMADVGKALRKAGLGTKAGESQSVVSGFTRKLRSLEVALDSVGIAAQKARGGHKAEVDKIIGEQKARLAADELRVKGPAEYSFTKKQVLDMIDEGLAAVNLYKKGRSITAEKIAGKKIALESLGDAIDGTVSAIAAVVEFVLSLVLAVLIFIVAVNVIALVLANLQFFLFATAVVVVISALHRVFVGETHADEYED